MLFTYLKNDPQVFARFKPDRTILRKINLDSFIESKSPDERNLALNLTSFLLRYHQEIDYSDFSDDENVIKMIKRAEMYRNWVDIEDLATGYESLHKTNDSSGKAFQEILELIDQMKIEMNEKIRSNPGSASSTGEKSYNMMNIYDTIKDLKKDVKNLESGTEGVIKDSNKKMKEMMASYFNEKMKDIEFSINSKIMGRIEALESNADIQKKYVNDMEDRFDILRERVDKCDLISKNTTNLVEKLESKVKRDSNVINDTKTLLIKTIENDPTKQKDYPSQAKTLKKCEEMCIILEEELETLKRETDIKREADVTDSSRSIKDISRRLTELISDNSAKFTDLNNLVADLRKNSHNIQAISDDYDKMIDSFKSQISILVQNQVNESLGNTKNIKKRMEILSEETEELWSFNQRFISQHAIDQERIISSEEVSITNKMEALEWFARYSEFLTPEHAHNGVMAFKDIYLRGLLKEAYMNYEHTNDSVVLVLGMIEKSLYQAKNFSDSKSLIKIEERLATQLAILEPLLINFQNLDTAVNRGAVELLSKLILTQNVNENEPNPDFKVYLKYAMKCTSMCLKSKIALEVFISSKQTFNAILDFISVYEDEDIVGNAAKIIKMMMNDPEKVINKFKSYNIAKLLVFAVSKFVGKSDVIVIELMIGLERYTRSKDHIKDIPKDMLDIIVKVARKNYPDNPAAQVLKNLRKDPKYEPLVGEYTGEGDGY